MTVRLLHRNRVTPAALAFGGACLAGLLCGCGHERLAGTSVGTGNPGMVTLGFLEGASAARVSGRVALYAEGHNPLVDSLPLAGFPVEDRDSLELPLDTLLERLRETGTPPDSLFHVNVLLRTKDGRGAWFPDAGFLLRSGRLVSLVPGGRIDLPLVPLDSFRGELEGVDAEGERHYLTLFGSPFFGRVTAGGFGLDSIPRGRYEARLVRFVEDAPIVADRKAAPVHALGDSLDTRGSVPLAVHPDHLGTVPLPVGGPRERP